MKPRIETIQEKKLIGKRLAMSLANDKTGGLWRSFMPHRKKISHSLNNDVISLQVYKPDYFKHFDPTNEFDKWATAEVTNFEQIPSEMESFLLPGGLYAVFHYKGSSADDSIFFYIFGTWLPNSPYELDNRPHFEVLGEKYKSNDPSSEEHIWIPIKPKRSTE